MLNVLELEKRHQNYITAKKTFFKPLILVAIITLVIVILMSLVYLMSYSQTSESTLNQHPAHENKILINLCCSFEVKASHVCYEFLLNGLPHKLTNGVAGAL